MEREADSVMAHAERALYACVAALLVAAAVITLGAIAHDLALDVGDGALDAVTKALDGLLLVFILVELLGAVRVTVAERQLLAEPFLLLGIIAAIKEIVVVSLKAGSLDGRAFDESMSEIGVLGAVVLVLALAGFLVRRKEREPSEE